MQRKSLARMPCPIARSLERVGEWWSMLIMRDALHGYRRFDEFQESLGIAPNMLTRRLKADPATRHIPVWIITGCSEPAVVSAAVAAGADGFFRKPFHPRELQARVREYMDAVRTGGVVHRV